jgi:hypothetical protein
MAFAAITTQYFLINASRPFAMNQAYTQMIVVYLAKKSGRLITGYLIGEVKVVRWCSAPMN